MARISKIMPELPGIKTRKRVAAYARVSMETELMAHSLSAQVSYYSSLIQKNPKWEYVGVYADEGISGTAIRKREEFKRLIHDCEVGKIDLVLVKSVSRFARDTVDTLRTTRHLKDLGVDVFFERENVHSMSAEGELLLTLLASFAQAEAESISANEKWSVQKHFDEGRPNTGILSYGYNWDAETKTLKVNSEEAKWVRYLYDQYLSGRSIKSLANEMKEKNIVARRGKPLSRVTIRRILSSEIYVGDLLLQKYYSKNIHKPVLNKGEMEQILVSNDHEPLVSREDFDKVQKLRERRARTACNYGYKKSELAGLIKCGKCGLACSHVQGKAKKPGRAYIECNSYKTHGCDLVPMDEIALKEIIHKNGGRDKIEKVVLFDEQMEFHMKNGTVKTLVREFIPSKYYPSPFSKRIKCGNCGCPVSKMDHYWICKNRKSDKTRCVCHSIRNDELTKAASEVLNHPGNLLMKIRSDILKTVLYKDKIEFHMKGEVKTWPRL